jgi:uncharacterized protein YkvS
MKIREILEGNYLPNLGDVENKKLERHLRIQKFIDPKNYKNSIEEINTVRKSEGMNEVGVGKYKVGEEVIYRGAISNIVKIDSYKNGKYTIIKVKEGNKIKNVPENMLYPLTTKNIKKGSIVELKNGKRGRVVKMNGDDIVLSTKSPFGAMGHQAPHHIEINIKKQDIKTVIM